MTELVTLLETSVAFEAEVLLQILSWNGIEGVISQDAVSNQFRVEVREGDKQAAKRIMELSGNNPPSYPDKFAFISHTASDMPFIGKKPRTIENLPDVIAQELVEELKAAPWSGSAKSSRFGRKPM
jgi:hypothetical protein